MLYVLGKFNLDYCNCWLSIVLVVEGLKVNDLMGMLDEINVVSWNIYD